MNKPLVIITGASQGIGLGLAQRFSEAGFSLGLLARNIKPIENLHLPNALAINTDVTDFSAFQAAIKSLSESLRMANAKYNIRICNVAPAKVLTPLSMAVNENQLDNTMISVKEFCETILWIYQQPKHICIRDIVIAPTDYEA